MSITDELRQYADMVKSDPVTWIGPGDEFKAIADRIDERHKRAVDKAHADGERNALQQRRSASEDYRRGYEAGKRKAWSDGFDEGLARADTWMNTHKEVMAEHGWVRLPVDADGVPICIGDKVTEHEDGHTFTVDGFMRWGGDDLWVFENYGIQAPAKNCTHAQPDTWERIIEDAIRGDGGSYGCLDERIEAIAPDLVARCRALAGEDE